MGQLLPSTASLTIPQPGFGVETAIEDLLVRKNNSNIELAVGLGGSGVVGVAGSTAINLIKITASYIDLSDITQNNAGETNDVLH